MMHVIRRANQRSFREIHQEIRSVQARPVPSNKGMAPWVRFIMLQPRPVPKLFVALVRAAARRDPTLTAAMGGTVAVTAAGMSGQGISGWGLTPMPHSLDLVVGSFARKPAVVADRIEPRESLNLTVVFDHDIIDGSPATRFVRRLVELIESGYGLAETDVTADRMSSQNTGRRASVVSVAADPPIAIAARSMQTQSPEAADFDRIRGWN